MEGTALLAAELWDPGRANGALRRLLAIAHGSMADEPERPEGRALGEPLRLQRAVLTDAERHPDRLAPVHFPTFVPL
jgi:hypothetical protein